MAVAGRRLVRGGRGVLLGGRTFFSSKENAYFGMLMDHMIRYHRQRLMMHSID